MNNWQRVFSSKWIHKAEIVKAVLEEHGLNPVIINKQDSSYKFGFVEVYVKSDEALKALNIIENEIQFK